MPTIPDSRSPELCWELVAVHKRCNVALSVACLLQLVQKKRVPVLIAACAHGHHRKLLMFCACRLRQQLSKRCACEPPRGFAPLMVEKRFYVDESQAALLLVAHPDATSL
eukprot:1639602-Rhodomonas_salina.1